MDQPTNEKPSKLGYVALALVVTGGLVGRCEGSCFGLMICAWGLLTAFAMVFFDARDGRRVSRPAVVALIVGPLFFLLTGGASP